MPVGNRSNDRVKRKSNTSSSYILAVMAQTTVRDKFTVKILKSCQFGPRDSQENARKLHYETH
jgi:hypothetical protein